MMLTKERILRDKLQVLVDEYVDKYGYAPVLKTIDGYSVSVTRGQKVQKGW